MSGVKGRSGRRIGWHDRKRREVLQKVWDLLHEYVYDKDIPVKDKLEKILPIASKDMTLKVDQKGGGSIIQVNYKLEFDKEGKAILPCTTKRIEDI